MFIIIQSLLAAIGVRANFLGGIRELVDLVKLAEHISLALNSTCCAHFILFQNSKETSILISHLYSIFCPTLPQPL